MGLIWKLIGVCGAVLALGAAVLSVAAHGGRFSERLDVLTHFAPVYAALAAAGLILGLMQAGAIRWVAVGAGLVGLAASLWLMAPEALRTDVGPQADAGAPGAIKVVQFNAWGGNARASEAAEWLLAQDADVIFLQEGGRLRDALVKRGGYRPTCGHCASLILTRGEPDEVYAPSRFERERVFVAAATLKDANGRYTVVGAHRHWPVRFAQAGRQTVQLAALLGNYDRDRLILAGDFNSTPWSFARRREDVSLGLIRRTRFLPTWPAERVSHNRLPAPFPYLPIDHVYAGPGWATVSVTRGPRLGSDHYPVVVTLAPAPAT
jgi:endonuclease/exonuclease/phosphatase (EEP) superfamily protein YafD